MSNINTHILLLKFFIYIYIYTHTKEGGLKSSYDDVIFAGNYFFDE